MSRFSVVAGLRSPLLALLLLIFIPVFCVSAAGNEGPRVKGQRITLDDILSENFTGRSFNGSWISDKEFAYRDEEGALMIYNVSTKTKHEFVAHSAFRRVHAVSWSISADRKFILFTHDVQKVFRYSYFAKYSIYEVAKDDLFPLSPEHSAPHLSLQYAEWGPVGNALVVVYKNDIYYYSHARTDDFVRVTTTGQEGTIWNGIPDWVYEEEVLSSNKALWFSDDGKLLCFATFNDTQVSVMHYVYYGNYDESYSKIASVRYPKPGGKNPEVEIFTYNLTDPDPSQVPHPVDPKPGFLPEDHYFTAVTWVDPSSISVIWMNRAQNLSIITVCNSPLWYCKESHRVDTTGRGWVDLYKPPLFTKDGGKYFVILPIKDGEYGYFPQVASKSNGDSKLEVLTHGRWEVTAIKAYDEVEKYLYYIAAPEGDAGQRHLYRVKDPLGKPGVKLGDCLTCNISNCSFVDAQFSSNAKYYILQCLGPDIPKVLLVSTRDNSTMVELDNNDQLREYVATKAMPQIQTFNVPIEEGIKARVRLFLPPGLRKDEITRYPLVLQVYGGPASQLVSDKFAVGLGHYLSSSKDIIYAFIDGRGSGFQGNKMLHELYRKLGSVEVEDQIAVSKYLRDNLHFVDPDKMAVWGWSYGGYVTAMIMGTDAKVFNCGISVAPVTNWRYYDTVYTERYMGMPSSSDNYEGYEKSDVLKKAPNFAGKKYYLIHGTADDNVHLHQSMMLTKALIQAGVKFRTQMYPDENHSLSSVKHHLYDSMGDFLDECFREEKRDDVGLRTPGEE